MKRRVLIFLAALFISILNFNSAEAQIEKGIIVNGGFGTIYSRNLNWMLGDRRSDNSNITVSNSHSNFGSAIGAGFWVQYPVSSRVQIQTGLSISYQSSKLYMNYRWDSLNAVQTGRSQRISTENRIKLYGFQVPVLVKYKLFENKRYYFISGITCTVTAKPRLKSEEENVATVYTNGILFNTEIEKITHKESVRSYNTFNALLTIGLEKQGRRKMKNMSMRASFGVPLTRNKFFSRNTSFYEKSLNNKALSYQGKNQLEEKSDYKLNDFRNFTMTLSVMYKLSKKEAKK